MTSFHTRERRGLGWIPDIRDPRDHRASASRDAAAPLPPAVVLWTPPFRDQRRTNSCVGQASASLFEYMTHMTGQDLRPSALFNYWLARHVPRRGWENEDEGAMPRDAMQSMISNGVLPEEDWPFTEDQSVVNREPPKLLQRKAKANRVIEGEYVRMLADDNLFHLKHSLAQGIPFLIGVDVYSSFFDTGSDGMTPMPQTNETFEGGHLMYCNGYDDSNRRMRCPNSWSESEGDKGVFWLPYEYVGNAGLAGDFWRIEAITPKEFSFT